MPGAPVEVDCAATENSKMNKRALITWTVNNKKKLWPNAALTEYWKRVLEESTGRGYYSTSTVVLAGGPSC